MYSQINYLAPLTPSPHHTPPSTLLLAPLNRLYSDAYAWGPESQEANYVVIELTGLLL